MLPVKFFFSRSEAEAWYEKSKNWMKSFGLNGRISFSAGGRRESRKMAALRIYGSYKGAKEERDDAKIRQRRSR